MNSFPEVHEEKLSRNSFIMHCWHQVGCCGTESGVNMSGHVWDVDARPAIEDVLGGGHTGEDSV